MLIDHTIRPSGFYGSDLISVSTRAGLGFAIGIHDAGFITDTLDAIIVLAREFPHGSVHVERVRRVIVISWVLVENIPQCSLVGRPGNVLAGLIRIELIS